ncbi:N(4)-(Beta-N-acetylglucosaminyl)-L-asparaginase [Blattella germanica]|nr:N(4)-(Beta-N-acetylglucosaminyl)-L-asparaginase [Blattella germanica]
MGAVGALRNVKNAISVARHVLEHTQHSMLVGDQATAFAVSMGFKEESLQTEQSKEMWQKWKENGCQPNFWMNVEPDPTRNCGPYKPVSGAIKLKKINDVVKNNMFSDKNHDTIGMVAIDSVGRIAAGTSTNGAKYKIPGFFAVEEMRRGSSPSTAGELAIRRIIGHYPNFVGAIVVLRIDGEYGAACHGLPTFKYSVCNNLLGEVTVQSVNCIE